jgi:hypothetical protein
MPQESNFCNCSDFRNAVMWHWRGNLFRMRLCALDISASSRESGFFAGERKGLREVRADMLPALVEQWKAYENGSCW